MQLPPESAGDGWMKADYHLSITHLGVLDFPLTTSLLQLESIYGPSVSGNPEDVVLSVMTLRYQLRFTLIFTNLRPETPQAY